MHPDEPSIEELEKMFRKLIAAESNDENIKKLSALEKQIERRKAEAGVIQKKPLQTKDL